MVPEVVVGVHIAILLKGARCLTKRTELTLEDPIGRAAHRGSMRARCEGSLRGSGSRFTA